MGNYIKNPYLWSWINFDGEHYLSIAQNGYKSLQHFYFPLYPILVGGITSLFERSIENLAIVGLVLSNITFLLALIGLWKLVKLDFSEKVARIVVILLLVFPTAYYFSAFYTESLFFITIIWSFYSARKKKWFLAGLLGALASSTRSIGVLLFPVLVIEFLKTEKIYQFSYKKLFNFLSLFLIPLGLVAYMVFLYKQTGNPFAFNYSGFIFGEYRSANPVILPQVFYRYIFKILPNLNYSYFAGTFTTLLEFLIASLVALISIFSISRIRLSYWLYLVGAFIIPTLYLSFVSTPRYALVVFPVFIFVGKLLDRAPRVLQLAVFGLLLVVQAVALAMFSRGYWVS